MLRPIDLSQRPSVAYRLVEPVSGAVLSEVFRSASKQQGLRVEECSLDETPGRVRWAGVASLPAIFDGRPFSSSMTSLVAFLDRGLIGSRVFGPKRSVELTVNSEGQYDTLSLFGYRGDGFALVPGIPVPRLVRTLPVRKHPLAQQVGHEMLSELYGRTQRIS